MKRLTQLFSPALARLAFWRKPGPTDTDPAEALAEPVAAEPRPAPADEAAEGPAQQPGWAARLWQRFRRRPSPATDEAAETAETAAPAAAVDETPATPDDAEAPPPSFLARLTRRLRRRPQAEAADADEAPAEAPHATRDETEAEAEAAPPSRMRRLLAALSRKRVWIPAASVAVLALFGTLGAMLWQSGQENAALQARLQQAEQTLKQTAPSQPGLRKAPSAATPPTGSIAAVAPVPIRSTASGADCDISSAASVAQQLKGCIDAFNQESDGAAPLAGDSDSGKHPAPKVLVEGSPP